MTFDDPHPGADPADRTLVREARAEDALACVELMQLAMPGILRFWISDDEATLKRCLRILFDDPASMYSRHCQWVVTLEGRVVAAMTVAPGREQSRLRRGLVAKLPRLRQVLGTPALVRSVWRGFLLASHSLELRDDELVAHSMAVLPEYRGRKVSFVLHAELWRMAQNLGLSKVVGAVESHNTRQKALVEAMGYEEVATCDRSSLRRYGLCDVHKYVKDLRREKDDAP